MEEISGALGVLILIIGLAFLVSIFVLMGKCQILKNQNEFLENRLRRSQQKNEGLEERVKKQSEIIKNLTENE